MGGIKGADLGHSLTRHPYESLLHEGEPDVHLLIAQNQRWGEAHTTRPCP